MLLSLRGPNRWLQNLPMFIVGVMLIAAFAFSGNLIGRNAAAQSEAEAMATADPSPMPGSIISMAGAANSPTIKSSNLSPRDSLEQVNATTLRRQTVISEGKGDLEEVAPVVVAAVPPPLPRPRPANLMRAPERVKITPAAYDLHNEDAAPAVKRIVTAPALPDANISQTKDQKQKAMAQNRVRLAEENCLARAIYFESRSESDLGQLAVAKVILNRVKNPDFPKTICGVVYQGSANRNSCQFSFACDGLPDDVKSPEAWAHARKIARRAIHNDPATAMLSSRAVNYHADYVTPRWAHNMRRLMRIGRHIFYAYRT